MPSRSIPPARQLIHLAIPAFSGDLRFKVTASTQTQFSQKDWEVPAHAAFEAELSLPPAMLHQGDTAHLTLDLANNGAVADTFHYMLTRDTAALRPSARLDGKNTSCAERTRRTIPIDIEAEEDGAKGKA